MQVHTRRDTTLRVESMPRVPCRPAVRGRRMTAPCSCPVGREQVGVVRGLSPCSDRIAMELAQARNLLPPCALRLGQPCRPSEASSLRGLLCPAWMGRSVERFVAGMARRVPRLVGECLPHGLDQRRTQHSVLKPGRSGGACSSGSVCACGVRETFGVV